MNKLLLQGELVRLVAANSETDVELFARWSRDSENMRLEDSDAARWSNGDTFVGIGIGEREYWGKGYGADAMRVILRFAFAELNLHRVSLDVFEYNPRAIRSYGKVGFKVEGCVRQALNREGRRWDVIYMGILREEWEQLAER